MLTPTIANVHHNRVPKIGAVVICHVDDRHTEYSSEKRRYRKFEVESYPGFGLGVLAPFTNGHLVNLVALDNGWHTTVAAQWLEEVQS